MENKNGVQLLGQLMLKTYNQQAERFCAVGLEFPIQWKFDQSFDQRLMPPTDLRKH